jgi:hypothetical protein
MTMRTRIALGALAAIAVAGATAEAAAARASTAAPRQLTFIAQPSDLQFFSNTGPIDGFPTGPLGPCDRIIAQDRILQGGATAGHDNEVCTVSFTRDVLCQDIFILDSQGDVQAVWAFRWPATGDHGPASFNGVIDGGTGQFRAAHGTFHATALPNGSLRITATMTGDD